MAGEGGRPIDSVMVNLMASTKGFRKGVNDADKRMNRFTKSTVKNTKTISKGFSTMGKSIVGAAAAFLSFRAAAKVMDTITQKTIAQEEAERLLTNAVENRGKQLGITTQEIIRYAQQRQNVTTFGDEDILKASRLILPFQNIKGDQFFDFFNVAQDTAITTGKTIDQVIVLLAKALEDPARRLSELSRSGIVFSEAQAELIKELAETGRMAEAQAAVIEGLESRYGGAAEAARDTLGGALQALSNRFGDLLEADGDSIPAVTERINDLEKQLQSEQLKEGFQSFIGFMLTIKALAYRGAASFGRAWGIVTQEMDINKMHVLLEEYRKLSLAPSDPGNEEAKRIIRERMNALQRGVLSPGAEVAKEDQGSDFVPAPREDDESMKIEARMTNKNKLFYERGREVLLLEKLHKAIRVSNAEYKKTEARLEAIELLRKTGNDFSNEEIAKLEGLIMQQSRLQEAIEKTAQKREDLKAAAQSMADSFADAFTSVITGTARTADAFKIMANQILQEITRLTVTQPISRGIAGILFDVFSAAGGSGGGGSGGAGAGSQLTHSNIFKDVDLSLESRASGGPLRRGQASIVGERGPEIITPLQDSYVHPGMGTSLTQNFIIQVDSSAEVDQKIADMADKMREYADRVVPNKVLNKARAGGAYSRNLGF